MVDVMIWSLAPCLLSAFASLLFSFTAWNTTQSLANSVGLLLTTFTFASVWRHYLDYPCYEEGDQEKCEIDEKGQWVLVLCIIGVAFFSASEVQRMRSNLLRLEQQALRSRTKKL